MLLAAPASRKSASFLSAGWDKPMRTQHPIWNLFPLREFHIDPAFVLNKIMRLEQVYFYEDAESPYNYTNLFHKI